MTTMITEAEIVRLLRALQYLDERGIDRVAAQIGRSIAASMKEKRT